MENATPAGDVETARAPSHANAGRNLIGVIVVEQGGRVLESIAVRILELIHVAIIAEGEKPAVGGVNEVVEIAQLDRHFANGEARDEQLHRWRIADNDQRRFHRDGGRREGAGKRGDQQGQGN